MSKVFRSDSPCRTVTSSEGRWSGSGGDAPCATSCAGRSVTAMPSAGERLRAVGATVPVVARSAHRLRLHDLPRAPLLLPPTADGERVLVVRVLDLENLVIALLPLAHDLGAGRRLRRHLTVLLEGRKGVGHEVAHYLAHPAGY